MDVLGDVMAVLQTGRPFAARFAWKAPWGKQFSSRPGGCGFQIVLGGGAVAQLDSGETIKVDDGDVLLFPNGGDHSLLDAPGSAVDSRCAASDLPPLDTIALRSDPDDEAEATHISVCGAYRLASGLSHPLLQSLPDVVHVPADPEARPELANTIAMLDHELSGHRPGGDTIVPALLDALLLYVLRGWLCERAERSEPHGWAAAMHDPAVMAALRAIHDEPARQWTVASLGAAARLSRSAFARRFTALVGQAPLAYVTAWRMTLGARLLRESDAPLSAVARQVGYATEFAFAAAFKRLYGVAPGRYRRDGQVSSGTD
jgi:AraC-like DNA-binding protein